MEELQGLLTIEIAGESVVLFPSGAAFWPSEGLLFVADLHLGKANHFRKAGIPIPLAVQRKNIEKLESIIQRTGCKGVFFLGDLFHSEINQSWEVFSEFRHRHDDVEFHLIEGNHDILTSADYERAGMSVHPEGLIIGPFSLHHHPVESSDLIVFCGHLHPAIRLRGKGRQGVKLPCFWRRPHQMVFPAFGGFTGHMRINPKRGDEIYALVGETVRRFGE